MNEPTPKFWKLPLTGRRKIFAWFGLLTVGIFLMMCSYGLATNGEGRSPKLILFALMISLALAALGFASVRFFRWLGCWRNFRRFVFGSAWVITLLALALAEENWRGKRAWQNHRREWEAKGEKFNLADLIPPPVPDEKNFAFTPLFRPVLEVRYGPAGSVLRDTNGVARLDAVSAESRSQGGTNDLHLGSLNQGTFADLGACAAFYRGNTNYPQAAAASEPSEAILTALGRFDPEIHELRAAATARPLSRFSIHYDHEPAWEILLPHLAHMRSLTTLLHVRATAELESGHTAEAFEDLKVGLRLSDSIHDEPILIDHLVRIASLGINLQTVREGLFRHAWADAQLSELETQLGSVDLLAEYLLAMRGERALSIGGLDFLRRKHPRDSMDYIGNEEGSSSSTGNFNFMPGGWFYQNMATISRMHQDYTLAVVDVRTHRVFPDVSARGTRALENLPRGPYTIFARMLLPALEKAVRKSTQMQTCVDAARVACALERYRLAQGSLPDTLEALTPRFIERIPNDIIDGKPLRYHREAAADYVLYSVGWNETDDGGKPAFSKGKNPSVDATQGDWVWKMGKS